MVKRKIGAIALAALLLAGGAGCVSYPYATEGYYSSGPIAGGYPGYSWYPSSAYLSYYTPDLYLQTELWDYYPQVYYRYFSAPPLPPPPGAPLPPPPPQGMPLPPPAVIYGAVPPSPPRPGMVPGPGAPLPPGPSAPGFLAPPPGPAHPPLRPFFAPQPGSPMGSSPRPGFVAPSSPSAPLPPPRVAPLRPPNPAKLFSDPWP